MCAYPKLQIVISIMVGSLYLNRRRNYRIFGRRPISRTTRDTTPANGSPNTRGSGSYDTKTVCGFHISIPDSSRWAHHIHSRILWKFPFLVEMFYWSVNYLFYSVTKAISQSLLPARVEVVEVAQRHGEDILNFEHYSFFSFLFPIQESAFQSYFILCHPSLMTFFNRIYSLVHIPGTVLYGFGLFPI